MQPSPQVQAVPLAQCRHGHNYPLFPINPRQPGDDSEMGEFRAGIRESGQLQPGRAILGKKGETVFVYIGGRRLTALAMNASDDLSAPQTIDLYIDDITPEEALCRSIAEQDKQQSLHPADHAKSFSYLVAHGIAIPDIAKRFGVKLHKVKQLLALGSKLTPMVWAAWRANEFDLAAAQAFTLASDERVMDEVFGKLKKSHQLDAYTIRRALQGDQGDAARFVNFIGQDAYIAAGGTVIVDLFEGLHTVGDKALAMTLAQQKLGGECQRLVDEGWAWAQPMDTLPASWQAWQRSQLKTVDYTDEEVARLEAIDAEQASMRALDELTDEQIYRFEVLDMERDRIQVIGEMRSFTDRQKKKSGCVLTIDAEGRLVVKPGLIRPAEPRVEEGRVIPDASGEAPESGAAVVEPPKEEKVPAISAALAQDLALRLNTATALVLRDNPGVAMAVALAALSRNADWGAVRLMHSGYGQNDLKLTEPHTEFAADVQTFLEMTPELRLAMFARVVACSLKFEAAKAEHHAMTQDDVCAIVAALPAETLREQLVKCFDPELYFEKAPKAFAVAAIEDMEGRPKTEELGGGSKAELVTVAARWAAETGWLPPELRPHGAFWDGRQTRAAAAAKGKATKTVKPAKKAAKPAAKKSAKKVTKTAAKKAKR